MKKTKIKKDLFNRIKEIGSENKVRGITLISLVITIIILLILAGISIAQLTGNGLFEKAKLAKEISKNAQEDEEDKIAKYSNEIDSYVDGNRDIKPITSVKVYTAKNSNVVDSISLNSYNISDFDYMLVTARCDSDSYATTSNIYSIDDLIIGTSSIRLDTDSNYTVYTITNNNTLTKHASSNQYYILSIRLIKL